MKTRRHPQIAANVLSNPCLRKLFLDAEDKMLKVREGLPETKKPGDKIIEPEQQRTWAVSTHSKNYSWAK